MQQGDRLSVDFQQEGASSQLLPRPALLTSHNSGWNGLFVEEHFQPATDTGTHTLFTHSVALALNSFCCERWLDASFYRESLHKGTVAIIPTDIEHRCATSISHSLAFMILSLTPVFFNQFAQEWVNSDTTQLLPYSAISVDPLILGIGLALKTEIESEYLGGKLYGESLANALAIHLLRHYCNHVPKVTTYSGGLSKLKLKLALDYIHTNLLDEALSLEAIATEAKMSQYYFCTLFKQSVGISPWKYVIQQRVERAKELLKISELSISEVALLCGFANQTHLNKHFQKLVGVTPRAYRCQ
ncbi:MAG: helix-turn-helix transcriptional regulator [Leptolyngbyaceae cyanobacterium RM2_2_4]|nr:helix-turn-helix transcriptional regulator [Leptolyngbyaceae cyanobacterium SM1_4_3]NJN89865.1 helix-turn-helix transcriptional regulator [Leptolyngbyaceae cyanobacterium SL_5_14]NJO52059.1 helix-turn-helix transcriptional regulator [Leptolyngbyaceae cyanobacterium RM2_2_4]